MIDDEQTRLTDEHQPPSKWNPDRLAREAEVASPNTANSAGASYLLAIRDAAVALIDESDPNQTGDAAERAFGRMSWQVPKQPD
jgi:hypothetical protein